MAQQHTSSGTRPVCSRGVPYSYHILPYVVQGLTVEGISGAGPWPIWLQCRVSWWGWRAAGQCCFKLIVGGAASLCVWLWALQWPGQAPSTNRPEGEFLNGTCWWSSQWLPPASLSPGCVPEASCLSDRLSKTSKWVWHRCLSDFCLFAGTWTMWASACTL